MRKVGHRQCGTEGHDAGDGGAERIEQVHEGDDGETVEQRNPNADTTINQHPPESRWDQVREPRRDKAGHGTVRVRQQWSRLRSC